MEITLNKLKGEPKVIGKTEDGPVMSLVTKGGLQIILGMKDGKASTLAMASHPALARFIASKKEKIQWNELSKSEVDMGSFKKDLEYWDAVTERIRSVEQAI